MYSTVDFYSNGMDLLGGREGGSAAAAVERGALNA